MDDSLSKEPATIKPPMSIEQSRAQRMQRQQARFRDRGGIFIPSNRNTLVDMLMGRKVASPKKSRGSLSTSPVKLNKKKVKRKESGPDDHLPSRRSSPRKAAHKPTEHHSAAAGSSQPPEAMVTLETTEKSVQNHPAPSNNRKGKAKSVGGTVKSSRKVISKASSNIDGEPLANAAVEKLPTKAKTRRKPTAKTAKRKAAKETEPTRKTLAEGICEKGSSSKVITKTKQKAKGKNTTDTSIAINDLDHGNNEQKHTRIVNTKPKTSKATPTVAEVEEALRKKAREWENCQTGLDGGASSVPERTVTIKATRKRPRTDAETATEGSDSKRTKIVAVEDESPFLPASSRRKTKAQASQRFVMPNDVPEEENGDEHAVPVTKSRKRPRLPGKEAQSRRKPGNADGEAQIDDAPVAEVEGDRNKKGGKRTVKRTGKPPRSTKPPKSKPSSTSVDEHKLRLKLKPRKSVMQRIKEPLPAVEDDEPDPIDFLC